MQACTLVVKILPPTLLRNLIYLISNGISQASYSVIQNFHSIFNFQTTQHQIDTREITKKIYDLNNDLDRVSALCEPRENCYVEYISLSGLESQLLNVLKTRTISGELKTSKTWPFLCRARLVFGCIFQACNDNKGNNI